MYNKLLLSTLIISSIVFGYSSSAKADKVRIISKASCGLVQSKGQDVGHVSIAFYTDNGALIGTKGMWPGGVQPDNSVDIEMASGKGCGLRTRTANVSTARREWIQNQVASSGGTNCQSYFPVGKIGGESGCSCVTFATRVWRQATSDWERWQYQSTPKLLGDVIQRANNGRTDGVFDNGKIWK